MDQSNSQFNVLGLVLDLTWNTSTLIALATTFVAILKQWWHDRARLNSMWKDRARLDAVEIAIKEDKAATDGVRQEVQALKLYLSTAGIATSDLNTQKLSGVEEQIRDQLHEMRREFIAMRAESAELRRLVMRNGPERVAGDGI